MRLPWQWAHQAYRRVVAHPFVKLKFTKQKPAIKAVMKEAEIPVAFKDRIVL